MTLCIQSLMKKLFLEEVSKMNILFQESNIRKERRQKRKKIFFTVVGYATAILLGVVAWDLFYFASTLEIFIGVLVYGISFIFAMVSIFITYLIYCELS